MMRFTKFAMYNRAIEYNLIKSFFRRPKVNVILRPVLVARSKNLYRRFCTFKQGFLNMNLKKTQLQYDFFEKKGGGSKTVWNFSENSSVLVTASVTK